MIMTSKYRRAIFNEGSFEYFKKVVKGIGRDVPEVEILEMNHDKDHIHMLLSIPPKMRVSDVVRRIKSVSGRLMKKKFDYIKKCYWGGGGIWSDGYFVSTIGIDELVIKRYIENQGKEDFGQAELDLG